MKITDSVDKSQLKNLEDLYYDFFRETDFDNLYNEVTYSNFSGKKTKDVNKKRSNNKFYFVLDNEQIVGFIQGKIFDDVGLICHTYVKEEYRKGIVFTQLYKRIVEWFKMNGIEVIEVEVSLKNPMLDSVERHDWQLYQSFDDASIYHRKI